MDTDNDELMKGNLDNIKVEYDLFGGEHKRLSVSERIGFVPISIWKPDWTITKTLKKIVGDTGESRADFKGQNQRMGASYKETLGGASNAVSIFNPHLAQMILSAYCPTGARIYDAFAGGGTRGFIASSMGHRYFGVEIRQEEVDRIMAQQTDLQTFFDIECSDSQFYTPEQEAYDFSYTCPPYYDLEIYSSLEGDMSNVETYEQFLSMLCNSLTRTFESLKPGSLCVWVVGNFRNKSGELVHFNGDLARIGKEIGFILHDELIFWGASGQAAQRAGQFVANRKSVRVHEYIIVFKKP